MRRFKADYRDDCLNILKKEGITFDRSADFRIKPKFGPDFLIHVYFMRGDTDVAYFTPSMNSLVIHETPRKWSQDHLDSLN